MATVVSPSIRGWKWLVWTIRIRKKTLFTEDKDPKKDTVKDTGTEVGL